MENPLRRIGMLVVSSDSVAEMDFKNLLPPSVPFFTARLYHGDDTPRGVPTLDAIVDGIEGGIKTIMQVEPELIVFACTSASFYKGLGWDEEITRHIAELAGVPALVTSTAVRQALHAVGGRRLFLMTPYPESLNMLEVAFFEAHGFEFVHQMRLETGLAKDIGKVEPSAIFNSIVSRENEIEEADTILLSCTALRAVEIIAQIEERFQKPVISSNQATAWAITRALNVEPERKPGALFLK